ncbi:hypothetical protein [Bacteroides reticulotermitis]|uniref:hypothetical protein n=1 Tax=Bacteroides reticulotermitis TaxID=1133319 RepID=UPI003A890708
MKKILVIMSFFCVCSGIVSCDDRDINDNPLVGNWESQFSLPKDTFEYAYDEQTDTIAVQGKPFIVNSICDMDSGSFVSFAHENDIQYKWMNVNFTNSELVLSLAENSKVDKRRMWMWLSSGDYFKNIYIVQDGKK